MLILDSDLDFCVFKNVTTCDDGVYLSKSVDDAMSNV